MNLSKHEKTPCFLYKDEKAPYGSFYEDKWFLDFSAFIYSTLFESDFVNMTLDNYS